MTFYKEEQVSVPELINLWINMMQYMLECAEMSMEVLTNAREKLNFSEEDISRFIDLFQVLSDVKHQLTALGINSFTSPPLCIRSADSFTQSPLTKKKDDATQTNQDDISLIQNKSTKDACLCDRFEAKCKKSKKHEIVVCSTLNRPIFINDTCKGCNALNKEQNYEAAVLIGKDDSENGADSNKNEDKDSYIIKHPGGITIFQTGFGYELFCAMRRNAERVAQYIEATNETQTFGEILRECISIALVMKSKGIDEKSIVTVCVGNTKQACLPYIAGLFLGCSMNALDTSLQLPDLKYLTALVSPNILFVDFEKIPEIAEALQSIGLKSEIIAVDGEVEGYEPLTKFLNASNEDIRTFKPYVVKSLKETNLIFFSSGTTGLPKAVCLSHNNILHQSITMRISGYMNDVFLSFTSLYWISCILLLSASWLGGTAKVIALPYEPTRIFKLIENFKVSTIFLAPYHSILLTKTSKPLDIDISSLRVLFTGGATIRNIVIYALREMFPDVIIFQLYGQTEVAGLITNWSINKTRDLELSKAKPSSCGLPFGSFWFKIVDVNTNQIVGPNKPGELRVKSDTFIMNGFFNKESSEIFDETGWLKTGDILYYDEHNLFYFVDRIKEIIIYRNWNISATELENILMLLPVVERAVVVGIPHPVDGEHPIGLIKLKENVDPETVDLDEIADFINNQVDDVKQLRAGVKIIENIPLTISGKVRRRVLRDTVIAENDLLN